MYNRITLLSGTCSLKEKINTASHDIVGKAYYTLSIIHSQRRFSLELAFDSGSAANAREARKTAKIIQVPKFVD